jgi:hypothetical protein
VVKAVVWGVLYLGAAIAAFVVFVGLVDIPMIGMLFMCSPLALIIAGIASPLYVDRASVREVRTCMIASAILLSTMIWAIFWPSQLPSHPAGNESAAILTTRNIHAARSLNGDSLTLSMARCLRGKTPAPDGSFSVYGYHFTIETLPGFGGECVVARPLVYNRSGLNTFVLAPDGVVYQRDLGDENVPAPSTWDPKSAEQPWIVCE